MAGLPIFRSQVSAIRIQARVIRFRFGAGINRFSPLSSIQSSVHFGWPVAAPGGRWQAFYSALHSALHSFLHSALRDRFSPLSSVIDSAIYSFRVAGGSPRWRVAGFSIQPSIQPSTQPSGSIQSSVIRHRFSHLLIPGGRWQPQVAGGRLFHSALHSVLNAVLNAVLHSALRIDSALCHRPSHPRAARGAAPASRQALPRYSILQTRYSQGSALPDQLQPLLRQQRHT